LSFNYFEWKNEVMGQWDNGELGSERFEYISARLQVSGLIVADTNDLMLGAKATSPCLSRISGMSEARTTSGTVY
jgi:hypothetical protein